MITWIIPVRPDGSPHPSTGTMSQDGAHPCGPGFIGPEEIDAIFPGNIKKTQTSRYEWTVVIPDDAPWAKDNALGVQRFREEMARVAKR